MTEQRTRRTGERYLVCNQDGNRDFCTNELARPYSVWPE
jgi:hypothetical protein